MFFIKKLNLFTKIRITFNPTAHIIYGLSQYSHITIKIYNLLGDEIETIVDTYKPIGEYEVLWDGTNKSGGKHRAGTYFVQLKAGDIIQTKKMVLLK